MNSNIFNNRIEKTIDECSYKFYIVKPDRSMFCACINHTTKQPNGECKICLGTGFKISIKMYKGASNEEFKGRLSIGPDATQITRKYFVRNKYKVNEMDLIIDEDNIFYVERIEKMRGLKGIYTHQEITAIKLKNDHNIKLNNFKEILNKYYKR